MSLISVIDPEQARGPVAKVFESIEEQFGSVPLPVRMWAVSPGMLQVFMAAVGHFTVHPTLSQPLLGWIRYLVAERDACRFCIDYNKAFLIEKAGASPADFDVARNDPAATPLPDKEKALLLLVLRAVAEPLGVTAEDVAAVRAAGFSEQEIFDAVAAGAFVAMDDVLINAFKVE